MVEEETRSQGVVQIVFWILMLVCYRYVEWTSVCEVHVDGEVRLCQCSAA